uniref:Uncharacterized protein n=1 Tax=Strongyloides venezuelensis TaxID=75913 RepID=A0A0K0FFP2_STRVS
MVPTVFERLQINVNGCKKNIAGTGFNVSLDELGNSLYKNIKYFIFGKLKISRITFASHLFPTDDNKSVVEKLKKLLKDICNNINDEGILVFLTYDVLNEKINNCISEEIHKVSNLSTYTEQFLNKIDIMRKALNLNFFVSGIFNNFRISSDFHCLSYHTTHVSGNMSQSLSDHTSTPSSNCYSTPRNKSDKTFKMFLRSSRNFRLCSQIFKNRFLGSNNAG